MQLRHSLILAEIKKRGKIRPSDASFVRWYDEELFSGHPDNVKKCVHSMIYDMYRMKILDREYKKTIAGRKYIYFAKE